MKICLHCGAANDNGAERCTVCDKTFLYQTDGAAMQNAVNTQNVPFMQDPMNMQSPAMAQNAWQPAAEPAPAVDPNAWKWDLSELCEIDRIHYGKNASYDMDADLGSIAERIHKGIRSKGLDAEPEMIRDIIAAMATSHILIVKEAHGASSVTDGLIEAIAESFGDMLGRAMAGDNWLQTLDMLTRVDPVNRRWIPSDVLRALYGASYHKNAMATVQLRGVKLSELQSYFFECLRSVQMPWDPQYITWKDQIPNRPKRFSDSETMSGASNLRVSTGVWYWLVIADDAEFSIPRELYDYAAVVDLVGVVGAAEPMVEKPLPISGRHFQSLISRSKETSFPQEEYWKRFDLLNEYLTTTVGYTFKNLLWRRLENYVSVFMACGGEVMDAMDHAIAAIIIPELCGYEREKLAGRGDELSILSSLEQILGEDHISASTDAIKKLGLI